MCVCIPEQALSWHYRFLITTNLQELLEIVLGYYQIYLFNLFNLIDLGKSKSIYFHKAYFDDWGMQGHDVHMSLQVSTLSTQSQYCGETQLVSKTWGQADRTRYQHPSLQIGWALSRSVNPRPASACKPEYQGPVVSPRCGCEASLPSGFI